MVYTHGYVRRYSTHSVQGGVWIRGTKREEGIGDTEEADNGSRSTQREFFLKQHEQKVSNEKIRLTEMMCSCEDGREGW
jgi:hypothetical protein